MREETRFRLMGYSFRLAARVLLYASYNTYHGLCYTSRGSLAGTRNRFTMKDRSDDPSHHERTLLSRRYRVKDHSEIRISPSSLHELFFFISNKGSFIPPYTFWFIIPLTGYHIPWPLLHQWWSTDWNLKNNLSGSTMRDRSNDPRTVNGRATIYYSPAA